MIYKLITYFDYWNDIYIELYKSCKSSIAVSKEYNSIDTVFDLTKTVVTINTYI